MPPVCVPSGCISSLVLFGLSSTVIEAVIPDLKAGHEPLLCYARGRDDVHPHCASWLCLYLNLHMFLIFSAVFILIFLRKCFSMKLLCVLVLEMCLVDAGPGKEHFGCCFFKLIAYLPVSVSVTS